MLRFIVEQIDLMLYWRALREELRDLKEDFLKAFRREDI